MSDNRARVFQPGRIGPLELRNRTIRAAAFEGMCPGGRPSERLIAFHAELARGGVGMTTVAYASVTRTGRTFEHQLWMDDGALPGLRRLTDAVHREGAAASIQLGHGGNMADRDVNGLRCIGPSAVFNLFGLARPRAMTEPQIEELIEAFGRSVALAREAGFDAVEIQAGHGYLISQFLAPHTNRRKDRWGGSLRNRARLARRVVARAREEAAGRLAVLVKTNLRDGFPGGNDLSQNLELARMLEQSGAHALVLSGGFVSKCPMYLMRGEVPLREMAASQDSLLRKTGLVLFGKLVVKAYPFSEAFFLQDALQVRQQVRLPLVLVGGLKTLETIEDVLSRGFDFVAMARALFREPDFVNRLQRGEARASLCEPCNMCMATMYYGEAVCPEIEKAAAAAAAAGEAPAETEAPAD
jgi:2,4-dienoyl-CoA reductase-like NADH-dependent reductase (Old Yellow Enzyme family)